MTTPGLSSPAPGAAAAEPPLPRRAVVIAHGAHGLHLADRASTPAPHVTAAADAPKILLTVRSLMPTTLTLSTDPSALGGVARGAFQLGGWDLVKEIYDALAKIAHYRLERQRRYGLPDDGVAPAAAIEYREQDITLRRELVELAHQIEERARRIILDRLADSRRQVRGEALRYLHVDERVLDEAERQFPTAELHLPAKTALRVASDEVAALRKELRHVAALSSQINEVTDQAARQSGPRGLPLFLVGAQLSKRAELLAQRARAVSSATDQFPIAAWIWDLATLDDDDALAARIRTELQTCWNAGCEVANRIPPATRPPETDPVLAASGSSSTTTTRQQPLDWFPMDPLEPYANRVDEPDPGGQRQPPALLYGEDLRHIPHHERLRASRDDQVHAGAWRYRRAIAEALVELGHSPPSAGATLSHRIMRGSGWTTADTLSMAGPLALALLFGPIGAVVGGVAAGLWTLSSEVLEYSRDKADHRAVLDPALALDDPPQVRKILAAAAGTVAATVPGAASVVLDVGAAVVGVDV